MFLIRFLEATRDLSQALPVRPLPTLLVLSLLIALLGARAGFSLQERALNSGAANRDRWWLAAGTVFGLSLWSMHFLGTLAFQLPIAVGYDVAGTLLSLAPIWLGGAVVLRFLLRPSLTHLEVILLAALLCICFWVTHLLGISAMRLQAEGLYHRQQTWLALGAGFVLITMALYVNRWAWSLASGVPSPSRQFTATLLGGAGFAAPHFLGIKAIYFFPAALPLPERVPEIWVWSALISCVALSMALLAISIASLDRRSQAHLPPGSIDGREILTALDRCGLGVALFDRQDDWVTANQRLRDLLGIDDSHPLVRRESAGPTSPSGKSGVEEFFEHLGARQKNRISSSDLEAWATQQVESLDQPGLAAKTLQLEDGRWVELEVSPRSQGRVALIRDVTGLREAEAELRKRDRSAERQLLELNLLHQVSEVAAAGHDFRETTQEVLNLICRLTHWPEGHVYEVDGKRLRLAPIWYDRNLVRLEQIARLVTRSHGTVGTPLALSVLETAAPVQAMGEAPIQTLRKHVSPEIRQAMGFPVLVRGQVEAILEFLSDSRRPVGLSRSSLENVGRQLARVFELQEALRGRSRGRAVSDPTSENSARQKALEQQRALFESRFSPAEPPSGQEAPPSSEVPSLSKHVLILLDAKTDGGELEPMLEAMDFRVTSTRSLQEALTQLDENPFDLVLLDLRAEGTDDPQVIDRIRTHDRQGKPRIVAMTATWFPDMQARVQGFGFDGHLTKPVRQAELEATLRDLV